MNAIKLTSIKINQNRISYDYEITGAWQKYFTKNRQYNIEYSEDISKCPASIAAIPFLTNILPVAWIFDAKIIVNEIDQNFYQSIKDFKRGYVNMYPKINFGGKLTVKKIVKNTHKKTSRVGAFYSGGLDATSTVIDHIKEKPVLINLQGSDIKLKYVNIAKGVEKVLRRNAKTLGLPIVFAKSGFRSVINAKAVDKITSPIIHDNYWHAFQHGIAVIGHGAPIVDKYNLSKVYIASSFVRGDKVTCASDPTIDNYVKLSDARVVHDGYDYSRLDKSKIVGEYLTSQRKIITVRVCLDDARINNCLHCEKCYRTAYGVIATGYDPARFGFNLDKNFHQRVKRDFKTMLIPTYPTYWFKIQDEFKRRPELKEQSQNLAWIYAFDFNRCSKNKFRKYPVKYANAVWRRIKRFFILRSING